MAKKCNRTDKDGNQASRDRDQNPVNKTQNKVKAGLAQGRPVRSTANKNMSSATAYAHRRITTKAGLANANANRSIANRHQLLGLPMRIRTKAGLARNNRNNTANRRRLAEAEQAATELGSSYRNVNVVDVQDDLEGAAPTAPLELPPHDEESDNVSVGISSNPPSQRGDLVVAMPVGNDNRQQALAVDLEQQQELREARTKNRRLQLRLFLILLAVVIATGIATSALLVQKRRGGLDTASDFSPTTAETAAPSSMHVLTNDERDNYSASATTAAPTFAPLLSVIQVATNHSVTVLLDPQTPQGMAYTAILGHPNLENMPGWRMVQLFALVTFYHAMKGPEWRSLVREDWLDFTKNECDWFSDLYVTVELNYTSPFEYTANYVRMDSTALPNVSTCYTDGSLNGTFHHLGLVGLDVSSEGAYIPTEIALLTALRSLSITKSTIKATLEEFLPLDLVRIANLTSLDLSENDFYGAMTAATSASVPLVIHQMTKLKSLDLGNNRLSGQIPSELGHLTNLETLRLTRNLFVGIPTQLGRLTSLTEMSLFSNKLVGPIPSEVGLLTALSDWSLLAGYGLTGTLPTELGSLVSATSLHIYGSEIRGPIPSELGRMESLGSISISGNMLSGQIPSELGLLTSVTSLYLNHNFLTGSIPSQLGMLTAVRISRLDNNSLTGMVPLDFCASEELWSLTIDCPSVSCPTPCSCQCNYE